MTKQHFVLCACSTPCFIYRNGQALELFVLLATILPYSQIYQFIWLTCSGEGRNRLMIENDMELASHIKNHFHWLMYVCQSVKLFYHLSQKSLTKASLICVSYFYIEQFIKKKRMAGRHINNVANTSWHKQSSAVCYFRMMHVCILINPSERT